MAGIHSTYGCFMTSLSMPVETKKKQDGAHRSRAGTWVSPPLKNRSGSCVGNARGMLHFERAPLMCGYCICTHTITHTHIIYIYVYIIIYICIYIYVCVLIYMWTYLRTYHTQKMWESKNTGM